jgi:hypothetical protein
VTPIHVGCGSNLVLRGSESMSENSVSADLDPALREIVHTAQSNTATENKFGYYGWRVVLAACLASCRDSVPSSSTRFRFS